jgi:hypothetical protein
MSLTPTAPRVTRMPAAPAVKRVRHQARDVVVMMAFSAAASVTVAAGLVLLAHLSYSGR